MVYIQLAAALIVTLLSYQKEHLPTLSMTLKIHPNFYALIIYKPISLPTSFEAYFRYLAPGTLAEDHDIDIIKRPLLGCSWDFPNHLQLSL